MKLERNGLHFNGCPRLDTFSDEHPVQFILLFALCWTVLCLAGAGAWLLMTV